MYRSFISMGRLLPLMLYAATANAQAPEALEAASRYPGENAVIRNNTEHLVFRFEDNQLRASSEVQQEILLLSDLAAGLYHTSSVYHSSFHHLESLEGWSRIPNKKDYKSAKASLLKSTNIKSENILFDDNKVSVLGFNGLSRYAITETRYTLEHTQLAFLPVFHLQHGIPTQQNTFSITTPKSVHVKAILKDVAPNQVTATVTENRNSITYTWTTGPLERFKDYDNGPSYAALPRIIPYITDYTLPRGGTAQTLISDIPSLYRFLYHFIEPVNKKEDPELRQKVQELTAGCNSDSCKAAHIYQWVQENVRYVAFEDSLRGFIPREGALVYHRRYGDCKDMSSLLRSMCRAAGLKAHLTWIGTRDKPYALDEVPLPLAFNHMICTWEHDGQWTFMDATHPSILFGVPPYSIQGKDALVGIDDAQFKVIRVPEREERLNTSDDSTWLSIGAGDELLGKTSICYSGYGAWTMKTIMRYNNESDKEKSIKSISSRGSNKYLMKSSDFRINGEDACVYATFGIKDYIQRVGKEVFINLNLQHYNSDQKVDDPKQRKQPIENNYKTNVREVIFLDIPKGYEVSYLPPDAAHEVPGLWGYSIRYRKTANQVVCTKEYSEKTLYITPAQFEQHNQLVDELNSHYKETISLKATAP